LSKFSPKFDNTIFETRCIVIIITNFGLGARWSRRLAMTMFPLCMSVCCLCVFVGKVIRFRCHDDVVDEPDQDLFTEFFSHCGIVPETSCAACSGAATICPRSLQVVTWTAIQSFQPGGHNIYINRPFDINVPVKQTGLRRQNFPHPWQLFDLSNSKWSRVPPVSWASFRPNLSSLYPSVLDLGSGTGQTEDGYQYIIPHSMGVGE